MEVNETLVDLEFVTVPSLGTFTARLKTGWAIRAHPSESATYRFSRSYFENFSRETNGTLDAQLLVLGTVDEIRRDWGHLRNRKKGGRVVRTLFQVLDVAARQGDADLVDFGSGDSAGCIVRFLVLGDVTHSVWMDESEGDWMWVSLMRARSKCSLTHPRACLC